MNYKSYYPINYKLLTKEKQGKNNNIKTYAEIIVKPKPKSKRVPKLIIKKNRQQRQYRPTKSSFTTFTTRKKYTNKKCSMQEQRHSDNKLHERREYKLSREFTGRKTI